MKTPPNKPRESEKYDAIYFITFGYAIGIGIEAILTALIGFDWAWLSCLPLIFLLIYLLKIKYKIVER